MERNFQTGRRRASAARARRIGGAAVVVGALLAACAGPDFKRPEAPRAAGYSPEPLPARTAAAAVAAGEPQAFDGSAEVPSRWWTAFGCAALNALVDKAFKANPAIGNAQAALRQAQELVMAQRGFFYPTVALNYTFERQKVAGNLSNSVAPGVQGNGSVIAPVQNPNSTPHNQPLYYNFHTAQVTVGYTPDVFGGNRRAVEALAAGSEVQRFALQAAYTALASNLVGAAIQEAAVREQIAAVQAMIESSSRSVDILRRQLRDGYVMRADVAAEEAQLAQVRALLPPLDRQLQQTRDLLRALVGNLPSEEVDATFRFADLHLPHDLPLTLPSKLVDQRPDMRAAEAELHAANAQVGMAVAARLPQFPITAAVGGTATQFNQMFASGGPFWNIVLGATQPLFDGGTLRHRQHAAEQALIQAATQYQSTVLAAYQDVADTLHAIYSDAEELRTAVDYEEASRLQLDTTQRQLTSGLVSELALLQAQQVYQQALINRIQAQAQRFGDTAALFVALGGGQWDGSDQTLAAGQK